MTNSRIFCILLLLIECTPFAFSKNVKNNIKFTMQLIEEGEKRIEIGKHEDIVLTLGNTGSGKSTLINFIATDYSKLSAVKFGNSIIIQDANNKISKVEDTIVSKTLFPELIYDSSSGTAYYDCSGFSDTRNSSIDIASNYFIHKIIGSIKKIKILLVVNYSSVTVGNDRRDFMSLLKHATDFMKNLKHLSGSIVLIVTKVQNIVPDGFNYRLQTDEEEINQIVTFLGTVKSAIKKLQSNENNKEESLFQERALNLLEIFSFDVNGTFPNIGIFRKPNREGALSEIQLMRENRDFLKEIIENQLIYSRVYPEDFGYTVSATSRNYIHDLILEMNEKFNFQTNEIIEKIISHCYNKEKSGFQDFDSFRRELIELYDENQRIFDNFNNDFLPDKFINETANFFNKFYIPLPLENMKNIRVYNHFLNFLNKVNSQPLNINSGYIMKKWKMKLEVLYELKNVYVFFSNLYGKLSEYKIQKNKEDFDVATLKTQIANDIAANIPINQKHFDEILNQIYVDEIKGDYNLEFINNIKNTTFNKIQVQLLMQIFEITLTPRMSIECYDQKLIVNGENVLLSQILNKCLDWTLLKIYAMHKVFFDEDIIRTGRYIRVIIIAPIWEVIDKREIQLIGTTGDSNYYFKHERYDGKDGEPGKPGYWGGTVFGIGYTFTNSKNLVITSKGGDGGRGQNGFDGANGANGWSESRREVDDENVITLIYNKFDKFYEQYHTSGASGGNGGHGGVGGEPGKAGDIQIIDLEENADFRIKSIDGKKGPDGYGGAGGIGGEGDYTCFIAEKYSNIIYFFTITDYTEQKCNKPTRSKSGNPGKPGFNYKNIAKPEINNINDKESYVNEFSALISNLTDPIKKSKLFKFLEKMYNKDGTLIFYEQLYKNLLKLEEK